MKIIFKSLSLMPFLIICIYSAKYHTLELNSSRTLLQCYYDPDDSLEFFIKDSVIDTFTYYNHKVFVDTNISWISKKLSKEVTATPKSYWIERNDSVFAYEEFDSIGTNDYALIVYNYDTSIVDTNYESNGDTIYTMKKYLGDFKITLGTFRDCIQILKYKLNNNNIDTIDYSICSPKIGFIYSRQETDSSLVLCELYSFKLSNYTIGIKNIYNKRLSFNRTALLNKHINFLRIEVYNVKGQVLFTYNNKSLFDVLKLFYKTQKPFLIRLYTNNNSFVYKLPNNFK